jgi:gamma-butyrobetaine dioxygenase
MNTHEEVGALWLEQHFSAAVSVPVRVHVAAKRYFCAVDAAYAESLSAASQLSLQLQGGPLSADMARRFERGPYFVATTVLRRWDDAAKVPGLVVPGLEHYRALLQTALKRDRKLS